MSSASVAASRSRGRCTPAARMRASVARSNGPSGQCATTMRARTRPVAGRSPRPAADCRTARSRPSTLSSHRPTSRTVSSMPASMRGRPIAPTGSAGGARCRVAARYAPAARSPRRTRASAAAASPARREAAVAAVPRIAASGTGSLARAMRASPRPLAPIDAISGTPSPSRGQRRTGPRSTALIARSARPRRRGLRRTRRRLGAHDVTEHLALEQMGGPHQRVGAPPPRPASPARARTARRRLDLVDERRLNLAQRLVGFALQGHDPVRRLEEDVHVLTRTAALDLASEVHGAQMAASRIEHQRHHPP